MESRKILGHESDQYIRDKSVVKGKRLLQKFINVIHDLNNLSNIYLVNDTFEQERTLNSPIFWKKSLLSLTEYSSSASKFTSVSGCKSNI